MENIVITDALVKSYGPFTAVKGINLSVPKGYIYALLGPNGAGKSTTLSLILGLMKPSSGKITLFGESWQRNLLKRVGASINGPALYDHLNAFENLEVHAKMLNLKPEDIKNALSRVNLTDTGNKPVKSFSMGMKSRLALAIALLDHPELLILDEPQNGLDPEGIRELRDLLKAYTKEGKTVLISSHQLGEVAKLADYIGVISDGNLVYQGTLRDLSPDENRLEEKYLELTKKVS
ncbi:ABC transporter ATP-binding protein [Chryseobacterium camelliae]|uniref:ABC transporter ATP-binding protein n=1 Tax=Chryseobacterium camelliae TaxID=1265445 RepID=UPI000C1CB55A|nr:ATP-binding cassette domain-containing protein [Chryseobacterium camelliae]